MNQSVVSPRAPGAAASPRRSFPGRALVVGTVLLAVLAVGCGSSPTTHSTAATVASSSSSGGGREPAHEVARNGGSMVIGVDAESDTWNVAAAEWATAGSIVGSSMMEPLAKLNAKGGADPYLATSWIADATFDKWEINLRSGVTFSDGEPFNAAAVVLNLNTYVNGALSGEELKPMIRSVEATGPMTVLVTMTQPWAAFPSSYLDGGASFMMAPAMIHSADGGATHPIGTGPFVFSSWKPGSDLIVKRNPTYWQKGLPHLDSIDFRVITDESTRVAALQSGDLDMMMTTNAADANRLASNYTVVKDWHTEDEVVQLNTAPSINGTTNPFNNIHARLALAYATNSAQVAAQMGQGVQVPTGPWDPTNVWGQPDSQNGAPGFDLTKARSELAAYEQATGTKTLTFTIEGLATSDFLRLLQELQGQWKQAGITANIQTMDQTTLIKNLVGDEFQAMTVANYNYADPDNDFVFWSSGSAKGVGQININFALYANPQIDADLATGRTNGYPAQRKAAYTDLVHQINAAALNVWLFRTPYSLIANHDVRGLNTARDIAFGNYEPKTWLGDLWLTN